MVSETQSAKSQGGRPYAFGDEPTERLNVMLPAQLVKEIKRQGLDQGKTPGQVLVARLGERDWVTRKLELEYRKASADYARLKEEIFALHGKDDPASQGRREGLNECWREMAGRSQAFAEALGLLGVDTDEISPT